ncbi:MAG: type II CAAX endopeptidase family protein [Candidatus Hydrogenedentales bacterium]|jgi:membrane protease YdiL (CAAX protease family)
MMGRTTPVLVALGSFVAIEILVRLIPLTPIAGWQRGLYWNYASHVLMIAVPVIALLLLRRKPAEYGLAPAWPRRELAVCAMVCPILIAVPILGEALFGNLALKHNTVLFVCSTILFQAVFAGFGEELLFRGFIQGELNRAFARRFRLFGVQCGWGLFIAATLFAVAHLLNPFNPFLGRYEFSLVSMLTTGVAGMIFGLVREHFGSILAAALIHGAWDLGLTPFQQTAASSVGLGVAIFAVCWILGEVFSKPLPGEEAIESPHAAGLQSG